MSVIAWDGKTLAADKQGNDGNIVTITKIIRVGKHLIGGTGSAASTASIFRWYQMGADPEKFPECQKDKERWSDLLVVTPDKKVFKYEQEPVCFEIEDKFVSIGSGSPYALSAMELGATAKEAVLIACKYERNCGRGVDVLEFE